MRVPHKYAKEISHWLNGGAIEYKDKKDLCWHDYNPSNINRAFPSGALYFIDGTEYRLKPEPEVPKTRVTLNNLDFMPNPNDSLASYKSYILAMTQYAINQAVENGDLIIPTK